jgi:hypothetical protein
MRHNDCCRPGQHRADTWMNTEAQNMKKFPSITAFLPPLAALLLSALLAACGGGGGGQEPILGGPSLANNLVAPTVTAVSPSANTTVPLNSKLLTATFSQAMDSATLHTSFTLACPTGTNVTGGAVSYAATTKTATLTLTSDLLPSTTCSATVTTGARASGGLTLTDPYVWNFTTSAAADTTPPTVTSTINANGATSIPINTKVGATFSKAMDPSTLTASTFSLQRAGIPVAGSLVYSGLNAVFTPTTALAASTLYIVTVSTGAKDVAGNAMAANYVWSWTTAATPDITAPMVTSTINANGATGVPINTKVGATFSEPMNTSTLTASTFSLKRAGNVVPGSLAYAGVNAVFTPTTVLSANTPYTVTIKGGGGGAADLAGNVLLADYVWSWTTAATPDTTPPTVTSVNPSEAATNVATSSAVNVTFSEPMNPTTLTNATFTVQGVSGTVGLSAGNTIATFTPSTALATSTTYTATVNTLATDLAGNALAINKVWTFTTAATAVVIPVVNLASAAPFGTFGGTAGMTNTGTLTQINGDIGTIATTTSSITGFHDTLGDIYTETPANIGAVNGKIYTCTNSTTGPTLAGANAASCSIATQGRLDAQTAYQALVSRAPLGGSPSPGQNLASLTLLPGVYKSASGDFMIQGGNLTLDAQGDVNATWVFQMASTLTVGGPGAAFPQSIVLAGGAQAKNVFWQVGSFATINAAGGGTMVGTIISQSGASFSTVGNTTPVTLQGRVLSLGASVTLVDTVINVPAP